MTNENRWTKEEKVLMMSGIAPEIFKNPRLVELKRLYEEGKLSSKEKE